MIDLFFLLEAVLLAPTLERTHYNTDLYIRRLPIAEQKEYEDYVEAYHCYMDARYTFFSNPTNKSLLLLIGYFTRWNKHVEDLDDKYGVRR